MTPSEIADNRTDLLTFVRTMFKARKGLDLVDNWHQEAICQALEKVVLGRTKRLIINIPPRSGKTEIAVINYIAWCMGNFPDSEFIHASYSKRLATSNAYNVRAIMQHEKFNEIFSHTAIKADSSAKDEFRTAQGGIVYATGADGTITGYGAGKMRDTFGGCFAYHQMVKTENGDIEIGELVSSKKDYRVWSYCEETGSARLSKILRHWKNPANDIIRIAMSDGSFVDCTPDHEILTNAGWVSAIHFANALNLVNAEPGQSSGLISCKGSVISDFNDAFRVLWLCIPLGVRESIRDRFPSLAQLNLTDDTNTNAETLCEDGSAFGALEYFNNLFSGELCPWSSFQNRECPMPESVLHIVGLGAIREIAKVVVGGVSVQMANLIPVGAFTYKLLSDKVRDVFGLDDSANGKVDSKVTLPIARRLKKSDGLCPTDLSSIRNLVQAECSRDVFPVGVYYAGHVDSTYCLEVECDNNFILSQSGAVVSNCIIIDDPHKAGEANSDTMRQNVLDWFSTTMESRKNKPDTPIIVIMQRLHEDDLSGFLLAGGNGEKWEHLNISAEVDGESFWPQQFPWDELKRKEAANSYVYAGQYLQRPAPIGGGIFKDAWWQYYTAKPQFEWRAIYADTAQKTKEHNDFSVFQCWGKTKDGKAYLLDMIRGKWEAPELLQQARAFWTKHKNSTDTGALRAMKIEDKVSGTGLIQTLGREGVQVKAVQRSTDKITRAMDAAPSVEAGFVYINTDVPFVTDFLREHSQFPNSKHDDTVDPCVDAVADMLVTGKRVAPIAFSWAN